mgnify:CR=1 FL=1
MSGVLITERTKDRILNLLVLLSISLLIWGGLRPSVPKKANDPATLTYSLSSVRPFSDKELPEFPLLEKIAEPTQPATTNAAQPSTTATVSVARSNQQSSGTSLVNTATNPKQVKQVLELPRAITTLLKSTSLL